MDKRIAHTTDGVITAVVHGNDHICSICGNKMFTTGGFTGLKCQLGHRIGQQVDGKTVKATVHNKGKK